jgi:hypothetical protein
MSFGPVVKDPDASLPYGLLWADWLEGDTIAASTWIVDDGITVVSDSNSADTTTVVLSGGVEGRQYLATNRITTAAGHTDDRSITFIMRQR